jgi:nucleotide-binding universal stress UspA family protein
LTLCKKVMMDGKNYAELVRDIQRSAYDLVVIGALGMGAVKHSSLGSVCERTVRRITTDVLVVKSVASPDALPGAPIVVGIDGSPQSYAGLQAAIALGKAFHRPVEAVAVYDPVLHYTVFHSLADVLTPKAARVFGSRSRSSFTRRSSTPALPRSINPTWRWPGRWPVIREWT